MLNVKEAVQIAVEAAKNLLGENVLTNLELEEVEFSEESDDPHWLITLGFDKKLPTTDLKSLSLLQSFEYARKYKTFVIDAETGKVKAMKMRQV